MACVCVTAAGEAGRAVCVTGRKQFSDGIIRYDWGGRQSYECAWEVGKAASVMCQCDWGGRQICDMCRCDWGGRQSCDMCQSDWGGRKAVACVNLTGEARKQWHVSV